MHAKTSWITVSQKAAAGISYEALVPAVVLTALAILTVGLRWYSRMRLSGVYGVEDVVVTLALIFSIAFTGTIGGEFTIDMPNTDRAGRGSLLKIMIKLMFAGAIFYHLAVNLVRFSIICQYLRLFNHLIPFRIAIYILFLATIAAMAWGVLSIVFFCDPIHAYWDASVIGKCMDAETRFWSCSLVSIVLDCAIWIMPMLVLGRLRLEWRAKVGLLVPFVMGFSVCIVSVLRLVRVHGAAEKDNVSKSGSYEAIWSTAEINVAIICSSLLAMKPLMRIISNLGTSNPPSMHEENSGIRRVMSISTLEESLDGTQGPLEARCEAYVWTESINAGGKGKKRSIGSDRIQSVRNISLW
ncbi:hypothetical protein BU23DRAFT_547697 [Bimuria novae-zelandiae CBS 107.79]|uniref:Rhodopsin domain-containing protein n=1 Tax=Bimuria novae-zelandiae CBS 107.79 TaxID=1447943 RepID=A0A6A5UIX9_9PLEO|nr:hypothetical protein BU23DRAFT_547697 [Bimuria novae-zelandiae CBS 107.79]